LRPIRPLLRVLGLLPSLRLELAGALQGRVDPVKSAIGAIGERSHLGNRRCRLMSHRLQRPAGRCGRVLHRRVDHPHHVPRQIGDASTSLMREPRHRIRSGH